MNRNSALMVVLMAVVCAAFSLLVLGLKNARDDRTNLQRQVAFLCETNKTLDDVLVLSADQIDLNFKNGTYNRLLVQRILTQENVDQARTSLKAFRKGHDRLVANRDCEGGRK